MYPIKFENLYYERIWGGKDLEKFRNNVLGTLTININEKDREEVMKYLSSKDIILEVL